MSNRPGRGAGAGGAAGASSVHLAGPASRPGRGALAAPPGRPRRFALAGHAAHADHPLAWLLIGCTLTGMLLGAADQTIVSAAMPKIIYDLSGFDQYAWITTAYLLGVTITMPLYGKLADLFEAKWVFLFGLLLFVAASALCGAVGTPLLRGHGAPMVQLMVLRALQGSGDGALAPVGIVIMSAFVTPGRRTGVMGTTGALLLMATVAGPVIGGWLTDHATWHWVFYINVPIGLAIAVLMALFLPRLRTQAGRPRLDLLGTALLALGAIPLLLVASQSARERTLINPHWQTPLLGAAAGLLVLFVIHERRHGEPIVDTRLLQRRFFAVTASATVLLSALTFACLIYIPLYAQGVLRHSATLGGLVLAPLMLASVTGRLVINPLRRHRGWLRPMMLCCLGLVAAGAAVLVALSPRSPDGLIVLAMVCLGAGLGASNALLFAAALSPIPHRQYGQATGTLLFLRSLGAAIITGALGSLLTARYVAAVGTYLPHRYHHLLDTRLGLILTNPRLVLIPLPAAHGSTHPVLHLMLLVMYKALSVGLHDVFVVMLALAVLALAILLVFPLPTLRQVGEEAALAGEGGVAAFGELLTPDGDAGPTILQIHRLWDIMCHVMYWRHGAVRFAGSRVSSLREFNRFEEGLALPSTLHDPAASAAFERCWPLVRHRTALDRYRAEAVVSLLVSARALDGDVATCGGTGDGLALLLALMVRELGLVRMVRYYPGVYAGVQAPEATGGTGGTGGTDGIGETGGTDTLHGGSVSADDSTQAFAAAHGLEGILVVEPGLIVARLAALEQGDRFCLIHIDSAIYEAARVCLIRLLPRAGEGAAVVVGQYFNGQGGAASAVQEMPAGVRGPLYAGPVPQVHFFAGSEPGDGAERNGAESAAPMAVDWSLLRANDAYARFLHWISAEVAACYAAVNSSERDRHIVAALGKLALPEAADAYVEHVIEALMQGVSRQPSDGG